MHIILGLTMSSTRTLLFFFLLMKVSCDYGFIFNGFNGVKNLSLDGASSITPTGLLQLTGATSNTMGHAFHRTPLRLPPPSKPFSFSTTFAFAIVSRNSDISGHGIAFVMSPTGNLSTAISSQFLGLFNRENNGNSSNHIIAVEIDTIMNSEFHDIDYNHVGVDVNGLVSVDSHTAGYYDGGGSSGDGSFKNMTLASGQAMQMWVEFSSEDSKVNVTLAPIGTPKPSRPLLSTAVNFSREIFEKMHVGFSSATGPWLTSHYILGWSLTMDGQAEPLDYAKLPQLPRFGTKRDLRALVTWLPLVSCALLLLAVAAIALIERRRVKFAEILEDWELEYGPHRFAYKELFRATKGFKDKMLLGRGGFGRVYRGVLPSSNAEVAVKRVSHESRQGMKEFVAEIVSIGRLRHRNIVQLLGYCRRKGELLLVYDFMPNGSLDKFLHGHPPKASLDWAQRFRIIKGVASGLLYLHQDWEKIVIHRDIKASNVLLDHEMNGRLGDFGLARLYDHGNDPQTTHIVGTMGYIAPELAKTGRSTTATDVFAFGEFLLEVVCGRRPVVQEPNGHQLLLVDWVLEKWSGGSLLAARDPRLRDDGGEERSAAEMEMVLKLGLLCSHPVPETRPSMRRVMQLLDGDDDGVVLRDLSPVNMGYSILSFLQSEGFDEYVVSFPSPVASLSSLSGGR
ncbi:L-type lectin-domain containing receptor kinase IV.2-like [Iris pallida]|uniref:non-specific serine/threonine protein kinase n=1 Tax=Iris pallida TaxID=29817 RepID=A0AAX6ETT6_IRIPA|nr:L-type lectin-domain containing receptor kinase IV.2-like [Iris pallida]